MKLINQVRNVIKEKTIEKPRVYDFLRRFYRNKNEEKLFLLRAAKSFNTPFKIMQIGANDGLRNDPVREVIVESPCEALFIEADPVCFKSLKSNYSYLQSKRNLHFENVAAVPDKAENMVFYSLSAKIRDKMPTDVQFKFARKASTNKDLFRKSLLAAGIYNIDEAMEKQPVETKTLHQLFNSTLYLIY